MRSKTSRSSDPRDPWQQAGVAPPAARLTDLRPLLDEVTHVTPPAETALLADAARTLAARSRSKAGSSRLLGSALPQPREDPTYAIIHLKPRRSGRQSSNNLYQLTHTSMTYKIFISHYSGDRVIADSLESLIDEAFVGHVQPFISSTIPIGENWLTQIKNSLIEANEILTIFTRRAMDRPWVNIETGFGIMSGLPVTPILAGEFKLNELPIIYRLQQAVEEREDKEVINLFTSILSRVKKKSPRTRTNWTDQQFLTEWRARVTKAVASSPTSGSLPLDQPLLWIIGSHDGLSPRDQAEALNVIRVLARIAFERRFRMVCGASRLLEYLADCHEDLAATGVLATNVPGDPWRKALGVAHAEAESPSHNPIILAGTLRTPNIRRRFDDAIGRIPDLAIVIGGRPRSLSGRTHEECETAHAAGIPLLPISFTGGAAAEVQPSLRPTAASLVADLNLTQGKLDRFAVVLLQVLQAQLDIE